MELAQNSTKVSSPCPQGLTPPDSPVMGLAMHHATMENLKHLFHVLERVLSDLTNREPPNTPVTQDQCLPGPNVVRLKQLLECASVELSQTAEPSQSCFHGNEQAEKVQVTDALDTPVSQDQSPADLNVVRLKQLLVKLIRDNYPSVDLDPIRTTSDDYESFKGWAQESTPQFKKIVETYEPPATFSFRRNMLTLV